MGWNNIQSYRDLLPLNPELFGGGIMNGSKSKNLGFSANERASTQVSLTIDETHFL